MSGPRFPSLVLVTRAVCAAAVAVSVSPAAASGAEARPLTVFAAASLADVLEAWAASGEAGDGVEPTAPAASGAPAYRFNFAASSALAEQIVAGAAADLFISADRRQVDRLIAAGRLEFGSVVAGPSNELVVVAPRESGRAPLAASRELLTFERIAMADPEAVPAGVYGRKWLTSAGLWGELGNRVVPTLDVRAALAAAATGAVPAAIVYATDAARSSAVEVVYAAPAAEAPPVRYWLAALSSSEPHPDLERSLVSLTSSSSASLFERFGFGAADLGRGLVPAALAGGPEAVARGGSGLGRIVAFTVLAAAGSTLLILLPGIALAWALSRRWRGRSFVEALVALPLVMPPTAVGFALLALLSPKGPVGALLERAFGISLVFSWPAVVVAAAVVSFPLLVRAARLAFEEIDPRLAGVARTLGRSRLGAFYAVELPLAWRGIAAGAVLALFALAVVSDLLDGPLARARGSASPRGALFDHGSDALLVSSGCAALAWRGDITLWLAPAIALAFLQYALGRARQSGQPNANPSRTRDEPNPPVRARTSGQPNANPSRALVPSQLGRANGIAYFVLLGTPLVRDAFALGWPSAHAVKIFAWLLFASTLLSMASRARDGIAFGRPHGR